MWNLIAWLAARVAEIAGLQNRIGQMDDADPMPPWPPR